LLLGALLVALKKIGYLSGHQVALLQLAIRAAYLDSHQDMRLIVMKYNAAVRISLMEIGDGFLSEIIFYMNDIATVEITEVICYHYTGCGVKNTQICH